jgi:hypothetical protein
LSNKTKVVLFIGLKFFPNLNKGLLDQGSLLCRTECAMQMQGRKDNMLMLHCSYSTVSQKLDLNTPWDDQKSQGLRLRPSEVRERTHSKVASATHAMRLQPHMRATGDQLKRGTLSSPCGWVSFSKSLKRQPPASAFLRRTGQKNPPAPLTCVRGWFSWLA